MSDGESPGQRVPGHALQAPLSNPGMEGGNRSAQLAGHESQHHLAQGLDAMLALHCGSERGLRGTQPVLHLLAPHLARGNQATDEDQEQQHPESTEHGPD